MIQGGNSQDAERNTTESIHMQTSTKSLLIGLALSSAGVLSMPVEALETNSHQESEILLKAQRIGMIAQIRSDGLDKVLRHQTEKVVEEGIVNELGEATHKADDIQKRAVNEAKKATNTVKKKLKKAKFW